MAKISAHMMRIIITRKESEVAVGVAHSLSLLHGVVQRWRLELKLIDIWLGDLEKRKEGGQDKKEKDLN